MTPPDHGLLDVVDRPPLLASDNSFVAAQSLLRDFAGVGSSYYLELRLGTATSERLDVLVGFGRGKQQALSDWLTRQRAELAGVRRASGAWNDGPRELRAAMSGLWLEYDDVGAAHSPRMPSVCACMVSSYGDSLAPLPELAADECLAQLTAMTQILRGSPLPDAAHAELSRCVMSLPRGGRVIHLSVMLGRPSQPIKLYCMLPRDELLPFLDSAGWRGPLPELEALVERYCPVARVAGELYVDLTVSGFSKAGGSVLGLAFAPQHLARTTERDAGRNPLLEQSVRTGLCSEGERQGLSHWPGQWLHRAKGTTRFPLLLEQWLDLKLVWSSAAPLALKAYLGASYRGATSFDLARLDSGTRQAR